MDSLELRQWDGCPGKDFGARLTAKLFRMTASGNYTRAHLSSKWVRGVVGGRFIGEYTQHSIFEYFFIATFHNTAAYVPVTFHSQACFSIVG